MAAYCYLCGTGGKQHAYFACNNCGGLVCDDHGHRDNYTKNCWCEDCLPRIAAGALMSMSAALEQGQGAFDHLRTHVVKLVEEHQVVARAVSTVELHSLLSDLAGLFCKVPPMLPRQEREQTGF